jgi:phage/plasmid-associated DNA primase
VRPDPGVLARIREGQYEIEGNQVYRLWRDHFDEENWRYFISSVGTWLYPKRFRHMAWLVGPPGVGKSSLERALVRPIEPIVARASFSTLTNYSFGLEMLIGKQIIVQSERGTSVVRNLDLLNRIMGEDDALDVPRKFRSAVVIPSMRSAMFAMNDLPVLMEARGSTFAAFLERLNIIEMGAPERFVPRRGVSEEVSAEEALYFLLWAGQRLEENGEVIEKRGEDELAEMVFEMSWALAEFWSDCVEEAPHERVLAKDAYASYLAWAARRGVHAVGRNEFYDLMAQRAPKVQEGRARVPAFIGIKLKCAP